MCSSEENSEKIQFSIFELSSSRFSRLAACSRLHSEMKVPCKLCNLPVLKNSMVPHAITHSNLDIFECGYCQKKFPHFNVALVHKHIMNQHKIPGEPIDYENFEDNRKELKKQLQEWKERCFPTE